MKKNVEYIILILLMIPLMVSSVKIAISDTAERKVYNGIVDALTPQAVNLAEHAPECRIHEIPPQKYNHSGKDVTAIFERPKDERFKIIFKSNFQDGFRLQKIKNYSYKQDPITGICKSELLDVDADAGYELFRILNWSHFAIDLYFFKVNVVCE